jgi:hypothetical protein
LQHSIFYFTSILSLSLLHYESSPGKHHPAPRTYFVQFPSNFFSCSAQVETSRLLCVNRLFSPLGVRSRISREESAFVQKISLRSNNNKRVQSPKPLCSLPTDNSSSRKIPEPRIRHNGNGRNRENPYCCFVVQLLEILLLPFDALVSLSQVFEQRHGKYLCAHGDLQARGEELNRGLAAFSA